MACLVDPAVLYGAVDGIVMHVVLKQAKREALEDRPWSPVESRGRQTCQYLSSHSVGTIMQRSCVGI